MGRDVKGHPDTFQQDRIAQGGLDPPQLSGTPTGDAQGTVRLAPALWPSLPSWGPQWAPAGGSGPSGGNRVVQDRLIQFPSLLHLRLPFS